MPTTVKIEGVGEVDFPDTMSESDIAASIHNSLPVWQEGLGKGVIADSLSRLGRDTAIAGGEAISGIDTIRQIGRSQALVRNLRSLARQSEATGDESGLPAQLAKKAEEEAPQRVLQQRQESAMYKFGKERQEQAQEYYKPNPAMDDTIRAKLIQGIASTIPVIASGPLAPITYAGMMGEHGATEAEAKGASPEKILDTFMANAALGITSEYLMGVPYLLRSIKTIKAAGETIPKNALSQRLNNIYKKHPVASLAARGAIAEAIQEGPIEQTGQNAIAKWVGQYDPERPIFQDVAEQAAYGAAIGMLFGAGFGAASSYDVRRKREQAGREHERSLERLGIDIAARQALDPRQAQLTLLPDNQEDIKTRDLGEVSGTREIVIPVGPPAKPVAPFGYYIENAAGQFIPTFSVPVATMPGKTSQVSREKAEAKGFAVSAELPSQTPQNTITRPGKEVSDEQKEEGQVQMQGLPVIAAPSGGAIVSPEQPGTVATLPPPPAEPEPLVRLYRAESPTENFGTVFGKGEKLLKFASDKPGQYWTSDENTAGYFKDTYGKDATIRTIDVPVSIAEKFKLPTGEYKIPSGVADKFSTASGAVARSKSTPLSARPVPGASGEPWQTLTDSQPLIDQALSIGGGEAALKALAPHVRIRYGPLPSGIPAQYQGGVITFNKLVIDFVAGRSPEQAQELIDDLIAHELTHAIADTVLTPDDYVEIAEAMPEQERQELLADRPDVASILNRTEQLRQIGGEYVERLFARERVKRPIDPNSTFGQRVLAVLQKILDYLSEALKRFSGRNTIIEQSLRKVRKAKADVLTGKTPIFEASDPLNAGALEDALALFKENSTKTRELGIGQAGEIVATNPTAQQTLAGLQAQAAIPNAPTANAQQRFLRDVARKVLSRPFIRKNLVVQSEHLLASTTALHGDLETLERLEASGASLEELSTAYSNAFETLQTFEQTQLDLNSAYARQLPRLVNRIAKNFDAEVETLKDRDVYSVLFKDFQVMGRLLMKIQKDAAVDAAYWQAVKSKGGTINVLKFIREHMDFTGMTRDDLHSVQDLMDRIRNTIVNNTGKFRNWDGFDVAKVVGASEDVIRSVLRIVALSEPIRTDIEESKAVVEGRQYAGPISALKTKLAEEIKAGKYANAFALYEMGIGNTAIELKASRDAANFYLRDTKRLLVNFQALVEAHEIAQKIASDPELIRQRNLVYEFARVQTITHTPNGTAITFLRADLNDPPIKLEFGNSQVSHQKMVDLAVQLHSEYQAYIANPDVPGFDPRLAAGMEKSLETLEYFTDPSQNPKVRARMLPGMAAKTFDWISGKVGYAGLIPKYLTTGSVGHLADIEHIARSAYSVVVEKIGLIEAEHEDRLSSTLKAALKAHNNITPGQYELLVFNPLASSRQNYNNPGMLKPGDRIGNGETVTVEDMAYLRAWRSYENALHEMVENTGQIKFQSVKLMFTGILFDKNGKVRIPLHHGPDTTSRQFPSVLKYWTDTWFELSPDKRIPFLDFWKDPLITGYIRGTREVDWKGSYSYRDEVRQIALDFNDPTIGPIENFDDLVNRVFELYNQKDGVEPKDIETIQNDLLSDFNDIFVKVKQFSEKGAGNPKVSLEVVGGDNSFNTPRSTLVMPPGWYKYGGVTKADRASSGRAATIAFQLAYQKALTALRDSLHSVVTNYEGRRKIIPEMGISEQLKMTKELMSSGDLFYSLGEAQRLLELVDNQLKHVNVMMDNSANPYVKDAVHMSMMRGGAQFVITSIVSGPAALIKNVGGGFQNLLLFDRMMFRNNMFYNLANRGADLVGSTLRELVYAVTHSGNPVTGGLRKLLENTENVAFIGKVSKLVLGYANRLREDYNHATDVGVNYNINLWGTTKARWKYSKTLGQPTSSNPSQLEGTANQLSLIGNTLAQYVGQAAVGYMDRGLNTKAIAAAVPLQKRFRDLAIEFGPYIEPSGLFPDKAISKGGWDTNTAAATIRDFFRRNGIGSIDGIMTDFYSRYLDDKAKEATPGELSSRTPFFTEDQFHQLQQIIAEDINLATFSTRPTFAKQSPFHAKLSVLWGYPTWFITKLVHLLDGLSNKSWIKNVGTNLPTLVSLGLAIALTAPLIYGAAAFIKRLFENKVTGFPTVFDAQNPQQFGQAVMAATADSVPFFGSALNMVTGAGYRTGFDLNSQFLVLNLLTDATKVFKEVAQTGDLGGPMQRFASRYFFPFNVIGSRLPGASGIREMSNTKNILAMGARGTGLETKLRKPGSGPSGANYSPSTPILNAAMDAIGRGDMPAFQSAYSKLVEQKRAAGSLNPSSSALTALKGRNPIVSVFGTKPTRDELEQVYRRVNPSLAKRARTVVNRFDAAIAGLPRRTVVKATVAKTRGSRRTGLRRVRLRRPTLRLKLQKPRLRRQLV